MSASHFSLDRSSNSFQGSSNSLQGSSNSQVICVGDPHFSNSSLDEGKILCQRVIDLVKSRSNPVVIILGDVLHRHALIDLAPLCLMLDMMSQLSQLCHVYVLVGNHDIANNKTIVADGADHALKVLSHMDNVTVIDKPTDINVLGMSSVMLPYYPTGDFPDISNYDLVFCHQEFKGCKMGNVRSIHGDSISSDCLVISGHIHDHQIIKHGQTTIIYPGTPFMTTFGESAEKMIVEITPASDISPETVRRSPEGVLCKYKGIQVTSIPMNIIPKVTLRCNPSVFWDCVAEADRLAADGCKVKIVVIGPRHEIVAIPSIDRHKVETKMITEKSDNIKTHVTETRRLTLNQLLMSKLEPDEREFILSQL